jgi:hypothetical protein
MNTEEQSTRRSGAAWRHFTNAQGSFSIRANDLGGWIVVAGKA